MTEASEPQHQIHLEQTHLGEVPMLKKNGGHQKIWSNYSDLTRPGPPKGSFSEGKYPIIPLFQEKI